MTTVFFSKRTGKLQTGLTYHHKFDTDTLHLTSTDIQDNIAQLIEDHETASKGVEGYLFYELVPRPTNQNRGERGSFN